MAARRLKWAAIVWLVALVATTAWIMSRTDGEESVSLGDAALVGLLVATVLAVIIGRK